MYISDNFLLSAYLVAVFTLNLFVYMIAEYYRKMVDRKLNPIGFIVSMCAISAAIGASFVQDDAVLAKVLTATLMTASIASLLNGIELYFLVRKGAGEE